MVKPMVQNSLILKKIPLFSGLSAKELKLLSGWARAKSLQKGEIVFEAGDRCERVIIIVSGRIKLFRMSLSGKEQILDVLQGGDTCACNPGLQAWTCSVSAQALTGCEILSIPKTCYTQLLDKNPKLIRKLNELFARRLCRFCSLIEKVSLDNPRRRLAKFLLDMIEDQKGGLQEDPHIRITHEEVSHRVGLVRETVTRHLQKLKHSDLVELKPNKIIIRDREGLRQILN